MEDNRSYEFVRQNHLNEFWARVPFCVAERLIKRIFLCDYFYIKSIKVYKKQAFDINCFINFTDKDKYINYEKVTKFTRDYGTYQTFGSESSHRVIGVNKRISKFK